MPISQLIARVKVRRNVIAFCNFTLIPSSQAPYGSTDGAERYPGMSCNISS